jgi:hypothetical protein
MSAIKRHGSRPSRLFLGIFLIWGAFGIGGCDDTSGFALSLQPTYTQADLDSDAGLNGSWTTEDRDLTFVFEPTEGKVYKLVVKELDDGQETSAEFEAHLMHLGAFFFVDILPSNAPPGISFYQMHVLRAHSIARIEVTRDTLKLAFFDASWLQKQIDEKTIDTSYQKSDGMLLLTGTTEEVQDLLFLHANEEGAFGKPVILNHQTEEQ